MMTIEPPLHLVLAGAALRGYREGRGLSLAHAACLAGCDRSAMSRVEAGQRGIPGRYLTVLLEEYGASPREQETVTALAGLSRGAPAAWLRRAAPVIGREQAAFLIAMPAASAISTWSPLLVPPLAQTPAYTAAVQPPALPGTDDEGGPVPDAAQLTGELNEEILRTVPAVTVLIGEAALVPAPPAGTAVMRGQIAHLGLLAAGPACVRILPASAARTAAGLGTATVLRFGTGVPAVACLAGPGVQTVVTGEAAAPYAAVFAKMTAAALPAPQTRQLLGQAAARLEDGTRS